MEEAITLVTAFLTKMDEALMAMEWSLQGQFWGMAVNRAYYAMFYGASALLARDGKQFREHGKLIAALGADYVKMGKMERYYHKSLHDAFYDRQEADYSTIICIDEKTARERAAQAVDFSNEIRRLLTPSL